MSKLKTKSKGGSYMKKRLFTLVAAIFLVLVGCQGQTDQPESRRDTDGTVQPTRFDDRVNRNNRTNEMTRDDRRFRNNQLNQQRTSENNSRDHGRSERTNQKYDVSKEAADKIVDKVDGVRQAYVLSMNKNAYVAVVLDHENRTNIDATNRQTNRTDDITDDLKKEIKDAVRSVDRNIDNVFVSTNPDFVDLITDYVDDFNEGRPVRGMFDQIGEMIERVFPQNR